jgi:hypothetical protein
LKRKRRPRRSNVPRIRLRRKRRIQLPRKRETVEIQRGTCIVIERVEETVVDHYSVVRGGDVTVCIACVVCGEDIVGPAAGVEGFLGDGVGGGVLEEVGDYADVGPGCVGETVDVETGVLPR